MAHEPRREDRDRHRQAPAGGAAEAGADTAINAEAAPHAVDLDRVIHERMRLAIVSALAVNDSLGFKDLKRLLSTSDGNVSVHTQRLEEAEYISSTKSFQGRRPRTVYRLLPRGRRALERYLEHMEALIRATRGE